MPTGGLDWHGHLCLCTEQTYGYEVRAQEEKDKQYIPSIYCMLDTLCVWANSTFRITLKVNVLQVRTNMLRNIRLLQITKQRTAKPGSKDRCLAPSSCLGKGLRLRFITPPVRLKPNLPFNRRQGLSLHIRIEVWRQTPPADKNSHWCVSIWHKILSWYQIWLWQEQKGTGPRKGKPDQI